MNDKSIVLVDAHVHIHECFDLNIFLNSSYKNFKKCAKNFNAQSFEGVLCLTENSKVNFFSKFRKTAELNSNQGNSLDWKFHITDEPNSIRLSRNQDEVMYIIAGRQIITKEKLEVLGIGLLQSIDNGKSLADVVELVNQNEALPIIPWGVGKWMGYRRKVISNFIVKYKNGSLFVGDNNNRPFFWVKSTIFKQAGRLNIRNLQGTDPLPFKSEVTKAGRYGFMIEARINQTKPFDEIKKKVNDLNSPLLQYGRPEKTLRFFSNQIQMQLIKRKKEN
jgi:hypothetical protein